MELHLHAFRLGPFFGLTFTVLFYVFSSHVIRDARPIVLEINPRIMDTDGEQKDIMGYHLSQAVNGYLTVTYKIHRTSIKYNSMVFFLTIWIGFMHKHKKLR